MTETRFAWIVVVACVLIIAAFAWKTPRCKPGDRALYIGGVFMAGCEGGR